MSLKFNKKKSILKNLTLIYGIGKKTVTSFYHKLGLNSRNNPIMLKKKRINDLEKFKKNLITDKKLKVEIKEIVNFSQKIKTYKGIRNKLHYPCRGQRTHTNAKTKQKIKI
jgi:small subunit ribosomal protein S13